MNTKNKMYIKKVCQYENSDEYKVNLKILVNYQNDIIKVNNFNYHLPNNTPYNYYHNITSNINEVTDMYSKLSK